MRTVLRVAVVVGIAVVLGPRVRAGDDPAPTSPPAAPEARPAPVPGTGLAGGGAAPPAAPIGVPAPTSKTVLTGRVVRGGRGVVARVRVWNLGSEETQARVNTEIAARFGISYDEPGEVAEARWLTRVTGRRATLALAGPESAAPADAEATAGEDGSFRIEVPGGPTQDRLVVARPEAGPGSYRLVRGSLPTGPPSNIALRLPLPPPPPESHPRLSVVLRRHDGAPCAGAVALLPADARFPSQGRLFAGRPEQDGTMSFRGVPEGGWRLRCTDDEGYEAFSGTVWAPRGEPFVFVVDEPGREVRGSVASSTGGIVAGAEVAWDDEGDERLAGGLVRSGADGTFRLRLPKRPLSVRAWAPEHDAAAAEVPAEASTVTIVLGAHGRLRGRVVDVTSGAPIAGVRVLVAGEETLFSLGPDFETVSGSDGAFSIELPPTGPVRLLAFGGGYMSAGLEDFDPDGYDPLTVDPASPPEGGFVLRVVPVARLEGRVVDPQGAAVAGALVSLSQADRMQADCGNGYRRDPIVRFLPEPPPAVTDAAGRFAIEPLRPALLYHASVSRPGFASTWEALSLEEGGTTTHTFRLARAPEGETRPYAMVVRVTDGETRSPLAGASVRVLPAEDAGHETIADASGVARVEGVVGSVRRVEASAEGYLSQAAWAQASDLGPGASFELAVALSSPQSVSGRVLDAAGASAARATVLAGPVDGRSEVHGRTTADGRFVLRGMRRGKVNVTAWLSRAGGRQDRGEAVVDAGASDVEVRLHEDRSRSRDIESPAQPGARFRVLGPDGTPVPAGQFRVMTGRTKPGSYVPDSSFGQGILETTGDASSMWWIEIYGAQGPGGGPLLATTVTRAFAPGATPTDTVIRCGEGAVLEGRVVTPDGDPVVGVGLFASRKPAPVGERRTLTLSQARTGVNGRFRLEGLPAEAVSLSFDLPGAWLPPRETRLVASKGGVEIVLRQAVRPWITVVDPAGEPVAGALLAVGPEGSKPSPSDWDRTTPRTGPKGRCRLGGLDPDLSYALVVEVSRGDAGTPAFLPFALSGWGPADTTVRLTPPGSITGQMRTPTGDPVPNARLYLAPVGSGADVEGVYELDTGEDGRFVLPNLKPGPVVLRYRVGATGPLTSLEVTVPARDLDLRLDPGPTWVLALEGVPDAPRGGLEVVWTPWQEHPDKTPDDVRARRLPFASPLRFYGVRPDRRYAVWVYAEADGLVGYIPDLPGEGGTRTLAMRPEGMITGTVTFVDPAEEFASSYVTLEAQGFRRYDFPRHDRAFTLKGLPPGRWTVHAEAMSDGEDGPPFPGPKPPSRAVTAEASLGDVVRLVIPARPR